MTAAIDHDTQALAAMMKSAANSIKELAEIRLAELNSSVRRYGRWGGDERNRIASEIGSLLTQEHYCLAAAHAIETNGIGSVIVRALSDSRPCADTFAAALKIDSDNMCSYSGRFIYYKDRKAYYKDDDQQVPVTDLKRPEVPAS